MSHANEAGAAVPSHDDDLDKPRYGAKAIGQPLGLTERQTYHAIHSGQLKVGKFLGKHVATKRQLLAQVMGCE